MVSLRWHVKSFARLTKRELYNILAFRYEVFALEQRVECLEIDGMDAIALHVYGVDKDGKVLAYARIIPPKTIYHGKKISFAKVGRVACSKKIRGQGLGKELMKRTIRAIHGKWKQASIGISAQAYLKKFYEDLGFKIKGRPYTEANIPHIKMELRQTEKTV